MYEEIAQLVALAERVSGDPDAVLRIKHQREPDGWTVMTDVGFQQLVGEGSTLSDAAAALAKELRKGARERLAELREEIAELEGVTNAG